jgi:hypothetical protein
MEPLLDTKSAAQRLTALGVRRSPTTLRKLRTVGGGPPYRHLNGRAYYTDLDLVEWISSRLTAPRRNSSEPVVEEPTKATTDLTIAIGDSNSDGRTRRRRWPREGATTPRSA